MTFSALRVANGQGLRGPLLAGLGFLVREEQSSGVNGSAASTTTDNVRVINTQIVNTISGAFLGSDEFTLPTGTYDAYGIAAVSDIGLHRFILYNKTDATIELAGFSEFSDLVGGFNSGGSAIIRERFTIGAEKIFEFRHYTEGADGSGLGAGAGGGFNEVYAFMHFLEV